MKSYFLHLTFSFGSGNAPSQVVIQPRSQVLFLNWEREKALASAGHVTPTISGCKNMLISVVFVNVHMNNKLETPFLTFHAVKLALQ